MNMRRSVIRCKYVFSCGDLPQFYSGSTLHLHDEVSKKKKKTHLIVFQLEPATPCSDRRAVNHRAAVKSDW